MVATDAHLQKFTAITTVTYLRWLYSLNCRGLKFHKNTQNYTEQNYKCNTFVFAPIFHELNSKIEDFFYVFLSNIVHKSV